MTQRAVVIGGGAIGMASAYYLSHTGWHVTVIDSEEIGGGCSQANACLIVASHSHPLPGPGVISQALRWMLKKDSPFYAKPRLDTEFLRWIWKFRRCCTSEAAERGFHALVQLNRASLELFEELSETLDFLYQRKGLLHVYVTDQGAVGAREEQDTIEAAGFRAQLLTRSETLEFEPSLAGRVRGGLFIEGEAHGNCLGYVRSLAVELEKRGVRLLANRPVSRILVEGGRVKSIFATSPQQEMPAELVVMAAGSWTPYLAKPLGISIPLQPAKGYSCTIDSYPGAPTIPIMIAERRVIITPLGERLRFGGTLELAGHDLSLNETRYHAVKKAACEVLSESLQMKNENAWYGLRPVLPDGLPIIDWAPGIDGLIFATGHAMLGFTQSPITGKLVAELANGQAPSVPLAPFRFDRFYPRSEKRSL